MQSPFFREVVAVVALVGRSFLAHEGRLRGSALHHPQLFVACHNNTFTPTAIRTLLSMFFGGGCGVRLFLSAAGGGERV